MDPGGFLAIFPQELHFLDVLDCSCFVSDITVNVDFREDVFEPPVPVRVLKVTDDMYVGSASLRQPSTTFDSWASMD
jgi:hypothetical protein